MATAKVEKQLASRGKGCLGKAAPDEPVFILRAQDALAPKLVEQWADHVEMLRAAGGEQAPGRDSLKIKEARSLAHQMRAWQALHGCKTPD